MPRAAVARALERGALAGPVARGLSSLWAKLADPARPVRLPAGARVVGVGGATLGGSGKTPVVLALARELSRSRRVAVVAPRYGAEPGRARVVARDDCVRAVGDEALWLARALRDVPVVAGSDRNEALSLAARLADVVLVDGLLQARPERLACSLCVLDGAEPWGAGRCPPAGDLRAGPERVLAAADAVLTRGALEALPVPVFRFEAALRGARTPEGEHVAPDALRQKRLGLVLAIARPERVLGELSALGIEPSVLELHADHAHPPEPRARGVEAWLTTPKCATKLGARRGSAPVWVLEQELCLPAEVVALAAGTSACRSPRAPVRARLSTARRHPPGEP